MTDQCRICGRHLKTGLLGMPQPLLPGDIPARREVCDGCAENGSRTGPGWAGGHGYPVIWRPPLVYTMSCHCGWSVSDTDGPAVGDAYRFHIYNDGIGHAFAGWNKRRHDGMLVRA
jgi:hypothetical protein